MAKRKNSETLPEIQRTELLKLMDDQGIVKASLQLGISRHAMERAAGGLTVQRGTVAYLTQKLTARTIA